MCVVLMLMLNFDGSTRKRFERFGSSVAGAVIFFDVCGIVFMVVMIIGLLLLVMKNFLLFDFVKVMICVVVGFFGRTTFARESIVVAFSLCVKNVDVFVLCYVNMSGVVLFLYVVFLW